MTGPRRQKLKSVLNEVPPGFLVDSRWLAAHDVAKSSAHDYHRDEWLQRVARGVYRRPTPHGEQSLQNDWKIAVLSAQRILGYDFHVGGVTALSLEGRSHYLSLGENPKVYLYGDAPSWFQRLDLDAPLRLRRRQLFGGDSAGVEDRDFDPAAAPNPWTWPMVRSAPERAILEALNELPDEESFHNLDMIFQGLATLRPGRLNRLLALCRSVKVKRLFFLFADRHGHGWLRHLDRDKVDLGKGPRALVEGGRFVAAYQLVVPEEFAPPSTTGETKDA